MRRHGRIATVAGLGVADHVCWSYDDEEALRAAAATFLEEGAALGLRLIYTADKPAEELLADLTDLPGVEPLVERGTLLVVPLGEIYDLDRLDPERQRAAAEATLRQALEDGYTGVRMVADGTRLAREPHQRAALARWEQLADALTASGAPISALCAYDRRVLGDGAVDELLCAHPLTHRASEQPPFRLFGHGDDVVLAGEVDLFAAPQLERMLVDARERCAGALDLSRLSFIDHHGVAVLGRQAPELVREAERPLTIRGASPALRRAWALTLDGDAPDVAWERRP